MHFLEFKASGPKPLEVLFQEGPEEVKASLLCPRGRGEQPWSTLWWPEPLLEPSMLPRRPQLGKHCTFTYHLIWVNRTCRQSNNQLSVPSRPGGWRGFACHFPEVRNLLCSSLDSIFLWINTKTAFNWKFSPLEMHGTLSWGCWP